MLNSRQLAEQLLAIQEGLFCIESADNCSTDLELLWLIYRVY
jgi:hypothetical protein